MGDNFNAKGRCPACAGGPMYQVVHVQPDPCGDHPEGCTPIGCEKCMPTVRVPCSVCGAPANAEQNGPGGP